jgi:hypothetical protein
VAGPRCDSVNRLALVKQKRQVRGAKIMKRDLVLRPSSAATARLCQCWQHWAGMVC